ncbi:MarR family winged helix-turn-helix transcriptional regulator [Teredinibacter haidensis]|uniref:MarR family winged helix-turn-helix transcriptional regulator n=1 Tax=Teredinibacter haidensis TaxID=2731755 RepID=UPI0009491527|nr:MarR family transcriptional regulator [Teredinibacter haidensis]
MRSASVNLQKLENQLCFPLYAASRLVTRMYQPLLEEHGLTYPQYVILMILWEKEGVTCGEIGEKAVLNSNTLTPILKRMEKNELLVRRRHEDDERKLLVYLTEKGLDLKKNLRCLPKQLIDSVGFDVEKGTHLRKLLHELIDALAV